MNKKISPVGDWDDLRKTINFTEEEEKEMAQEMAIMQAKIDARKIKGENFQAISIKTRGYKFDRDAVNTR